MVTKCDLCVFWSVFLTKWWSDHEDLCLISANKRSRFVQVLDDVTARLISTILFWLRTVLLTGFLKPLLEIHSFGFSRTLHIAVCVLTVWNLIGRLQLLHNSGSVRKLTKNLRIACVSIDSSYLHEHKIIRNVNVSYVSNILLTVHFAAVELVLRIHLYEARSMERIPWQSDRGSAVQGIPLLVRNPKVHYFAVIAQHCSFLSQINPVYIHTPCLLKITPVVLVNE